VGCLRNTVDITEGIPKEATLNFCRGCERFLSPPQSWTHAQPESRELLGKSQTPHQASHSLPILSDLRAVSCARSREIVGSIWLMLSYLPEKDRSTFDESPLDRRLVYLDRTAFPSSQAQNHRPEGSFGKHGPAASLRAHLGRPHRTMSRLYATSSKEHLEGVRPG
jgi:hypothetical protein